MIFLNEQELRKICEDYYNQGYIDALRNIDRKEQSEWRKNKKVIEVIHHPAKSADSYCLYGKPAWDKYIYG